MEGGRSPLCGLGKEGVGIWITRSPSHDGWDGAEVTPTLGGGIAALRPENVGEGGTLSPAGVLAAHKIMASSPDMDLATVSALRVGEGWPLVPAGASQCV